MKKVKLTKKGEEVVKGILDIAGDYETATKILIEIQKRETAKKNANNRGV